MTRPLRRSDALTCNPLAWTERGTVPPPVEDDSLAAWEEFEACAQALGDRAASQTRRPGAADRPAAQRRAAEGDFVAALVDGRKPSAR